MEEQHVCAIVGGSEDSVAFGVSAANQVVASCQGREVSCVGAIGVDYTNIVGNASHTGDHLLVCVIVGDDVDAVRECERAGCARKPVPLARPVTPPVAAIESPACWM